MKKHTFDNISWCNGHIRVIACTPASEMGMNCKGVHHVVHFGPAKNLQCYVQECERAGRDEQPSTCLLLHNRLLAAHCADDIRDYFSSDKEQNSMPAINSGRSHIPGMHLCLQEIWFLTAHYGIDIFAWHVAGMDNPIADHLSPWHLSPVHHTLCHLDS